MEIQRNSSNSATGCLTMVASVEIGSSHTALSECRAMNFLQQQSVCLSFLTKDRIGNLNQTLQR